MPADATTRTHITFRRAIPDDTDRCFKVFLASAVDLRRIVLTPEPEPELLALAMQRFPRGGSLSHRVAALPLTREMRTPRGPGLRIEWPSVPYRGNLGH